MAKRLFIGLTVAFFIAGSASVSALTVDDIQNQIRSLLSRVAELQAQIVTLQTPPSTPSLTDLSPRHRICALINRNLTQGSRGDDVLATQEFLQSEGYLAVQPTGYFGPATASAIAKWQASQGVSAVGSFGPMSRERIKIWCGGGGGWGNKDFSASPLRGSAPLSVTFYSNVGGGRRPPSVSFRIDFGDGSSEPAANCYAPTDYCQRPGTNTHTYVSDGVYMATMVKTEDPCGGNPLCMAPVSQEVIGKVQIHVGATACPAIYQPVCGAKPIVCIKAPCNPIPTNYSNRCAMNGDGASFLYEGQCRTDWNNPADDPQCKSWSDGCNTCARQYPGGPGMCTLMACQFNPLADPRPPYCKEWFNTSANKPPVISSFSGPTTLSLNQQGTWTIAASDPENQSLSYSVTWGDELRPHMDGAMASYAPSFVQSTTFTHSYANPGTYTVIIVVRDSSGQSVQSSSTVRVGGTACTEQYAPVCGRPQGCAPCPPGLFCAQLCAEPQPVTYGNRCQLNAASASFLYDGACRVGMCVAPYYDKYTGAHVEKTYAEGEITTTIRGSDGSIVTIADAHYVCRSGQWKVEGGLPAF